MKKRPPQLLLILFFLLPLCQLPAQDMSRQELIDSLAIDYLRSANRDAALYYGYPPTVAPPASNHPYLNNNMLFEKGRLSYNHILYPEVMLRYDMYSNELVAMSGARDVVLIPENVDFAELSGKRIIYFRSDSLPGCPPTGYYFLLNAGKCLVLEKRTASLLSNTGLAARNSKDNYDIRKVFYLYKEGVYHRIRSQSSLLKLLQPYRKELKQYISSLGMKYRQYPDLIISFTVDEYEKLTGL